jgi:multimeric flavodoxin WrbA
MKVVAFNGSARAGGNTAKLIKHVFDELEKEGIETELIELSGKNIHGCRACGACRKNKNRKCAFNDDIANECIDRMIASDGIILGSPTYFSNPTPEILALMDRAFYVNRANDELFKNKVGAAVVAVRRAGGIHVFNSLNHFFFISQMIVPGSKYWNIGYGLQPGDVEKDSEGLDTMKILGQNMAWLLKKLHTKK